MNNSLPHGATPPNAELISFLNYDLGAIGRTVSTKTDPNTPSQFLFWLGNKRNAKAVLQIGNIVAAMPENEPDLVFGTVVEMRSYSDVESFMSDYLSHNFGETNTRVPTDIAEVVVVTCAVMQTFTGAVKPVGRSSVYFPNSDGIQFSYGLLDTRKRNIFLGAPIPVGVFENGDGTIAPISVDEAFLLGPEGAHLNVSGISGLASKTSAIQFTVKSVLTHTRRRVAVVMINVKSQDLLYIDQPNPRLRLSDELAAWSQRAYANLDVEPSPFRDAKFFVPNDAGLGKTKSLRSSLPTTPFSWNLEMMYRDIPTLFNALDWDDKMEGVWHVIQTEIEQGNFGGYDDMLAWVQGQINANQNPSGWMAGGHTATWNKMRSHLERFPKTFTGLVDTSGLGSDIPWDQLAKGSVYVIDIQMLSDQGQRFAFARAIQSITKKFEEKALDLDNVIVFVDELNKFAPSGSQSSPLKKSLVNITARGRSLGLVLFGAEQFASSVEKEVVENSSTYLFGRSETNELRSPNYGSLSNEVKAKLTMLPQGRLLIRSPKFAQPIFLRFPLPPCCPGDQFKPTVASVKKAPPPPTKTATVY